MSCGRGFEFRLEHRYGKFFSDFCECCRHRFHVNPLNAELNPIRHLLALVGARHIVHVSRIRVKAYPVGFSVFYLQLMLHLVSSSQTCLSRLFLIRESTLKSKEITIERRTSRSIYLKFSRAAPFLHSFIHVISVFLSRLMSQFISEHPFQ